MAVFQAKKVAEADKLPVTVAPAEDAVDESFVRRGGISATLAWIHLIKAIVGAGYLALPMSFKQAGLWTGLSMIALFGLLNINSTRKLVHCSQFLGRKKGDASLDYGNVAYETFATGFEFLRPYKAVARAVVNVFVIMLQIGICAANYLFICVQTKAIIDQHSSIHVSVLVYMLCVLPLMMLLNLPSELQFIGYFSTLGSIAIVIAFVFVMQFLVREELEIASRPAINSFDGVMTATGMIMYAFEGQACVLPIENQVKHPGRMPLVIVLVYGVVIVLFGALGFAGYAVYGEDVEGSITLNLPDNTIFNAVKILMIFVSLLGFTLQQYVIVDMVWPTLEARATSKHPGWSTKWLGRGLRAGLVVLEMGLAALVPNLENIIPLIGVSAGMMLALVFPGVIQLLVFLPLIGEEPRHLLRHRVYIAWRIFDCVLLIAIGCFAFVAGLRATVLQLVHQ